MKRMYAWMFTAVLICGASVFTSCTDKDDPAPTQPSLKEELRALYGENKKITDGNYDHSLAVKCINGTFVGRKTGSVIAFKGIPFVGEQPVGVHRWKAPVEYTADDGVYEAYYNAKSACQPDDATEPSVPLA